MLECEGRSRNVFAAISISISNQAGISRRIFRSQDRQVPPTVFCHSFLSFSFTRRLLFSGRPLYWSDFPLPCKSKSVVPRAAASWWSASEPIRPLPNFSALDRFGVIANISAQPIEVCFTLDCVAKVENCRATNFSPEDETGSNRRFV